MKVFPVTVRSCDNGAFMKCNSAALACIIYSLFNDYII